MKSRSRLLAELSAQHDGLRGMMERCEQLADEVDAGRMGPLPLTREVARLRLAFDAHNRFEEPLLRPVLLEADGSRHSRLERLIDDHVSEHRAMRDHLTSPATAGLRAVIAELRAHLDAEERYFVSARAPRGGAPGWPGPCDDPGV